MEYRKRILLIFGIVGSVTCCGLGGLAIYVGGKYFDFGYASHEAGAAVAAYRKSGLPWEAKDLAPNPPITTQENAAPLLKKAGAAFDLKQFNLDKKRIAKELDSNLLDQADKSLARYSKGLDLAVLAAKKPSVDFKRDWDMGPLLLFPEYAEIKNECLALCYRAELKSKHKGFPGALADLTAARGLARLAGQDPTFIALLVKLACEKFTLDAVQRIASAADGNQAALDLVSKAIQDSESHPTFANNLVAEAYMGLAAVRNQSVFNKNKEREDRGEPPIPINPDELVRSGLPENFMARAMAVRFLQEWTEFKPQIDRFHDDPLRLGAEMKKITDKWQAKPGASNILAIILMPVYDSIGKSVANVEAQTRCTSALIAALQIKARTGALPTSIAQIPGTWTDPFSGRPLLVRSQPGGIRIYSVGPNGADDGGFRMHERKTGDPTSWDIVAAYPPLPRT